MATMKWSSSGLDYHLGGCCAEGCCSEDMCAERLNAGGCDGYFALGLPFCNLVA